MDLAKVELRGTAIPSKKDAPGIPTATPDTTPLEVNATITRPDTSSAEFLTNLLGLANEVGQSILNDTTSRRRSEDEAAAMFDFSANAKNDVRFAKSREYRDAWQNEGAKKLAIDIADEAHQATAERLANSQNPATLSDIDATIEAVFQKHITDGHGGLREFGTVQAKKILAQSLSEIRAGLLPQAAATIKKQTDEEFLSAWATNSVHELRRGVHIGADPLAPLPDAVSAPVDANAGASVAPQAAPAAVPFNLEDALSRVPPGIDKGQAKAFLLQALTNEAWARNDLGLLDGLEDSKRPDGTPSLTPDEVQSVAAFREHLAATITVKAAQARTKLWDGNADAFLLAFESDQPPSIPSLRDAAHKGLIDPQFAFTMENWAVNQRQEAEASARSSAREARADADAELDIDVGSRIALRQSGDLSEASAAGDLALFNGGQLGAGKRAIARFRQLRAAERAGEQENLRNPEVAVFAGQLRQRYGQAPKGLLEQSLAGRTNFYGMLSYYRAQVAKGVYPGAAYADAVDKFGPKVGAEARLARIAELKAKRAAPAAAPTDAQTRLADRVDDAVNRSMPYLVRTLGAPGFLLGVGASGIANVIRPDPDASPPKRKSRPSK